MEKYKIIEIALWSGKREEYPINTIFDSRDGAYEYIRGLLRQSGSFLPAEQMQMTSTMIKWKPLNEWWEVSFGDPQHYFIIKQVK